MSLGTPRNIFGIHSITPYNRTTGKPYGILKVLGGANLELTGELEDLYGGSQKFPWATEVKTISGQVTANVKAYPDFLFDLFLGGSTTLNAAEASGNVSSIANVKGTSVFHATTGIASVSVIPSTGAANLKFGKYIAECTDVATDTVTLYCLSDIDFKTGTDATYTDDTLAVGTAIIPGSAGTIDVATLGLRFTGGSGTVVMVLNDTAEFYVRPINTTSSLISIGQSGITFPEFGCLMLASKRGSYEMFEIEAYKCLGSGMPINLQEGAWSIADLTFKMLYDSAKDSVFRIRNVNASA